MKIVTIKENDQIYLKMLSRNTYEVNGQIKVDDEGRVKEINYQKGQLMTPCWTGCLLNFHTHPPDYETLYPDHPSATDFKYIYNATCRMKELSAHLIVTPKYLYVVYYNCRNPLMQICDFFTLNYKIDQTFRKVASGWDRSTEDFRLQYIKEMRNLGFVVQRFSWGEDINFQVNHLRLPMYAILYVIMFICLCVFLYKKYIS